jgi:tRNA (guanine37-N1)-methyltransferase
MRVDVVSIFPDYLAALDLSLVGKARQSGLLDLHVHDFRGATTDRHRTVDDTPFGGGAGMVMRPDVWGRTIDAILDSDDAAVTIATDAATTASLVAESGAEPATPVRIVIPTPSGPTFTQRTAEEWAGDQHLIFACGRYEGIDARVADHYRQRGVTVSEISIGDYVLNGGEVAALVIIEAVARLIPGMVGNPESLIEESHGAAGLLEYPVYTKPPTWEGLDVPDVLLSGHHAKIARWRRDQSLHRTSERRPDLIATLDTATLDKHDLATLRNLGWTVVGPSDPAHGPSQLHRTGLPVAE